MDIKEARIYGKECLEAARVSEAGLDCDLILEDVISLDKNEFVMNGDRVLGEFEEKLFKRQIDKRSARLPLAQVLGKTWFYGHELLVDKNVLTPRQETEILVEWACSLLRDGMRVFDLCTGSGCIAVSMAAYAKEQGFSSTYFAASDISYEALNVARKNAGQLGVNIDFFEGDMTLAIPNVDKFDIITANPPYIKKSDIDGLEPEVSEYEPRIALDGGEDGLNFYRRLAGSVHEFLKDDGVLIMEIGHDQAMDIRNIFSMPYFDDLEIVADYAGLDRVCILKR